MGLPTDIPIFDADFLARLERLHLLARRLFRGTRRAERRSRRTGASMEFADHRNYTPGDDLRRIDWNLYGRSNRLSLKLFEEEEDLPVHLLLDTSASMRWRPEKGGRLSKFDFGRRIAAAVAYLALAGLDRVNIHFFSETLGPDLGMVRGKNNFHSLLRFLSAAPDMPPRTSAADSARAFVRRLRQPGIAVLIGDCLDPDGWEEALRILRHDRFDTHVIQILDPDEINPPTGGDWRLVDAETGRTLDVTADPRTLAGYRAAVKSFLARVESACRRTDAAHVRALTNMDFADVVLKHLRQGGVVK